MGKMRNVIYIILLLAVTANAQNQSTFQREVVFQKIQDGKVVAEHIRRSQLVYDDRGRFVETILFKSPTFDGLSDKDVNEFLNSKEPKPRPGISMLSQLHTFRRFGSKVEVKDTWDAHWPPGQVKVYLSRRLTDRDVILQVLDTWNALVPEVQFVYAGEAEEARVCLSCLTVLRDDSLSKGAILNTAERDGVIWAGRIYLRKLDRNTLFSVFAHEVGHSLGLDHSVSGLMQENLTKGKLIMPSQLDVERVRGVLKF